jgi:NAD(P)-dependent dehydrogenase (short-subunit alcohol dehydrogenase family)
MAEVLAGKATLMMGGASGIGRTTAVVYARGGALLVIADVDMAGGEETAHLFPLSLQERAGCGRQGGRENAGRSDPALCYGGAGSG